MTFDQAKSQSTVNGRPIRVRVPDRLSRRRSCPAGDGRSRAPPTADAAPQPARLPGGCGQAGLTARGGSGSRADRNPNGNRKGTSFPVGFQQTSNAGRTSVMMPPMQTEFTYTIMRPETGKVEVPEIGNTLAGVGRLHSTLSRLTIRGNGGIPTPPAGVISEAEYAAWKQQIQAAGWEVSERPWTR